MTIINPLPRHAYQFLIEQALAEDIGRGDITSQAFIAPDTVMRCAMVAREPLCVAGIQIARDVFHHVDNTITLSGEVGDGAVVTPGTTLLEIQGNARHILAVERSALNMLSYLSGIATMVHNCVEQVKGTGVTILDTRKTLPGYRELAKYAVRCGGGQNHRMRLDDGVMLKDNHIAIAGDITSAVQRAKAHIPALTKIEVECDTLAQVQDALDAKADVIMLDNMSLEDIAQAVTLVGGRIPLEVSGGVTPDTLRDYADTGVNFISMGALTHSVRNADIGLDIVSE